MQTQTTKKTNIYFPDGAKVEINKGAGYVDLGAINSSVTATLEWEESQIETANAGPLAKVVRAMTMSGGFTLINLDPVGIELLGGGVFELVSVAGAPNAVIPNQIVPSGWNDNLKYEIVANASASDSTKLRLPTKPVLTSVILEVGGAAEALAEIGAGAGGDYMVVADSSSYSGWSILFNSTGMVTGTPKTKAITIAYGENTPQASQVLYAGSSSAVLSAYAVKITHTDSNSKVRMLELFSVDADSGGFQFSFKGANEDGVEEMPLTFKAKIDTTRTDGRQLMAWTIEAGAM